MSFIAWGSARRSGSSGKQLFLLEEFLVREQARGQRLPLRELPATKALVHGHCHQKAFGTMKSMRKIVGSVPGLTYELIDLSCCGMAGSFGLEAEHRGASQAMADLSLLPVLRAAPEETRQRLFLPSPDRAWQRAKREAHCACAARSLGYQREFERRS